VVDDAHAGYLSEHGEDTLDRRIWPWSFAFDIVSWSRANRTQIYKTPSLPAGSLVQ